MKKEMLSREEQSVAGGNPVASGAGKKSERKGKRDSKNSKVCGTEEARSMNGISGTGGKAGSVNGISGTGGKAGSMNGISGTGEKAGSMNGISGTGGKTGSANGISGSGRKKRRRGKSNMHNRDISSKTVFRNPVLCAQFLRDNCDIQVLKNVHPEDIEDISERYLPYLGTELDSDSAKKIRILDIGSRNETEEKGDKNKEPHFIVSLIDHKSLVDYDVSMQLLRYMMCIWTEYRREMETKQEGCSGRKSFRYPVIIPIIYYEGKAEWTADRQLSGRIENSGEYREWIPDFKYEVIRIHDYSNEELLKRGDEMSLIMMINKIRDASDLEEFIHIPPGELDRIIKDSPGHVLDVIVKVMESLCFKIDVSKEERTQCVQRVRARKMGYLFENMEHISLQEERRKTKEQRRKTEEERRKTEEQRRKTEEERRKAEEERRKTEEERRKTEEERRKAEEERQKAEEQCRKTEEQRRKTEEQRQRAEEAEEKLRIAEETIKQLLAKDNR